MAVTTFHLDPETDATKRMDGNFRHLARGSLVRDGSRSYEVTEVWTYLEAHAGRPAGLHVWLKPVDVSPGDTLKPRTSVYEEHGLVIA